MKGLPIGIFDSGVGGLTVAKEIIKQIPNEKFIYFGDTARLPYGSKSKETILKYSRQIIRFLMTKKVKAIVIACNTASANALETVKKEFDIPIIGVIHAGAKAACEITSNGKIGVIGTFGTISSNIYPNSIKEINPEVQIIQKACPLLCPLVEEGLLHDSVTDEIVSRYMSELKGGYIDTLVLGCTHYPLLYKTIRNIMGDEVKLVNPARETAKELKDLLRENDLLNEGNADNTGNKYEFYVSDMADRFKEFAKYILPKEVKETYIVDIEKY